MLCVLFYLKKERKKNTIILNHTCMENLEHFNKKNDSVSTAYTLMDAKKQEREKSAPESLLF